MIGNLKTNRQTGLSPTTKISNYSPAGKGGLSTRRPALKTNHNEKENLFVGGYPCRCGKCLRTGQRAGGQAGITEATNLITGYFDPGTKLVYAIGAVCGLIGGVKVYNKFSSGDPDTSKTAASWFGACIFLIVAATILRSFFL